METADDIVNCHVQWRISDSLVLKNSGSRRTSPTAIIKGFVSGFASLASFMRPEALSGGGRMDAGSILAKIPGFGASAFGGTCLASFFESCLELLVSVGRGFEVNERCRYDEGTKLCEGIMARGKAFVERYRMDGDSDWLQHRK